MKQFWCATAIAIAVVASDSGTKAQTAEAANLSGIIHDFTSASFGSWEINGEWSLALKGDSGHADFSAVLAMIKSDYWLFTAPGADPENPAARSPHTHHISLVDGTVTTSTNDLRVTGPIAITANGNPFGSSSSIQVDITGGNSVPFSNVKVTFGGDAAMHFGSQPLDGVVRFWH